MPDPSQPLEVELERRRTEQRELIRSYKRFFTSEDGKRVLLDLEKKYHWGDDPYTPQIEHGELAFRCGTHSPLRYINKMRDTVLAPLGQKPVKRSAKSKANHE